MSDGLVASTWGLKLTDPGYNFPAWALGSTYLLDLDVLDTNWCLMMLST